MAVPRRSRGHRGAHRQLGRRSHGRSCPASRRHPLTQSGSIDPGALPAAQKLASLEGRSGSTSVFVEFSNPTTRDAVFHSRIPGATPQARATTAERRIEATADAVVDAIDGDVTVLYTATNGLAGVAVTADADALRALADRDDVVSIRPLVAKELTSNSGIDIFTGSAASWQDAGTTGEGQTIAVIDSGIDFTHASFNADPAYAYPTELNASTKSLLATTPTWPQGKVLGGWDFAGLNYTADGPPSPDGNPLDEGPGLCGEVPSSVPRGDGHGSHVAGTAGGWGVASDGTTFDGDYSTLTDDELLEMQVGPGSAPDADLVALKIFGCAGSSLVTGAALDWLLDPTNELAEQVTVVNMSIGSDFSTVDDPENELIEQLVADGKVVVTSAGNAGDTTDIGGSPGNANATLSVANSVADTFNFEGASVSVGGAAAETVAGQYSIAYLFPDGPIGPSEVVTLTPGSLRSNSGCDPYSTADRARVAGKTVVVAWDDTSALPCGSAGRAGNAAAAGATGIVFTGLQEVFAAGLTGDARIPTFQFTGPVTADLLDYEPATGVITIPSPLTITFDNTLSLTAQAPSVADTLNDSSSRGVHGSLGSTKPDVAAPGTTIASVAVGSGNGWTNKSGTSMASPHAAGVAALTRAAHPDWTPIQVKAGVMNTANHDVTLDGTPFGPQRVGSGRVDALQSVNNSVIAYDKEDPTGVSLAFGVVELTASTAITRTMEILNTGASAVTLGVGYTPQTEVPGVEYVLSADSVTVPAGGTATVDVTLTVTDPAAVARTLDPTMAETEPLYDQPREFLTTPQGWVELSGAPAVDVLRVPVSGSVKPASAMVAGPIVFGSAEGTSTTFELVGRGVDQEGFFSVGAPFELVAQSPAVDPEATASLLAADIKSVGVSQYVSEYGPYVAFGIEMQGPWATLGGSNAISLEIATDHGDYSVGVQKIGDGVDNYDWTIVGVWDEEGENVSLEYLNDIPASVDTNTFDSSVAVLPVNLEALGFTEEQILAGEATFTYSVTGSSWIAESLTGNADYDTVEDLEFTFGAGLLFGDGTASIYEDLPGTAIDVTRLGDGVVVEDAPPLLQRAANGKPGVSPNSRVETSPSGEKILFLHLHNAVGQQAQVIEVGNVDAQVPGDQLFVDVPQSNQFFAEITWLANQGITTGWDLPDGKKEFRPLSPIARDAMAAFLYRMAGEPAFEAPATSPFVDVATTNQFYKEITWAHAEGITTGWVTPAGTEFRPVANITRDAISAFLYRFAGEPAFTAPATSGFVDVTPSTQFYKEISWMASAGVSQGWLTAEGTYEFKPLNPVARDAMAAFLYRLRDIV